jgi:type I restriction enzyme S subunit
VKWKRKRLEELADFSLGQKLDQKKNKGMLHPYLANINVRWGAFDLTDLRMMRFEPDELDRYALKPGDIVMCEGGEPGRCAIWKGGSTDIMIQKALHRIRAREPLDSRFLYYSFLSKGQIGGFDPLVTGSTIKHLPRQNLAKVEIDVPPVNIQRRIADILSTYDDLIEVNTRRIAVLEEMARLLFDEWFVELRFPGHSGRKNSDAFGPIPKNSHILSLDALMDFEGGTQPPKEEWSYEPADGLVRMIQIRDYKTDKFLSYVQDTKNLRKCETKDVMIARYGASVARICWGLAGAYNVALVKVVPHKSYFKEFLRNFLNSRRVQELLISMSGRTAQAGFNKSVLKGISLVVPDDAAVIAKFEAIVSYITDQILFLMEQSRLLRASRDLLLPKLISGEINLGRLDSTARALDDAAAKATAVAAAISARVFDMNPSC